MSLNVSKFLSSHREERQDLQEMISSLPKAIGLLSLSEFQQYQSFWFDRVSLEGFILAQQHFQVEPTDIIMSSSPKSGTTWLNALAFALVTRHCNDDFNSPLLTILPHNCLPMLEFGLLQRKSNRIGYQTFLSFPHTLPTLVYQSPYKPHLVAKSFTFVGIPRMCLSQCGAFTTG
ncbi:hypothetical protein SLEP1_g270 [Rubroshorea leprosula]|uniref:Sulfotransferase n=1 Tax=Rubroshorea leprosula TaxID=152421 RepID=A0AAV5HEP3_9ROSI|nr:hypothetical protein SLEP1_g270 [Rubroshorea leprosula]